MNVGPEAFQLRPGLRCAIYARYSSKGQHETSIPDQIRECRRAAAKKGWTVLDEFIRFDKEKVGQSMVDRPGLQALLDLAESKPSPFDVIMADDTSRLGRSLSLTLPLSDRLAYSEVILYFVNQQLESTNPHFRDLFIKEGRQDEQFSIELGKKVKRGQIGRVERGYVGSGRTYGYDNVPVEIPESKGLYGRPKVEGVRLVVNRAQADIVVRIFEMRAAGISCLQTARTLNREGVPPTLFGSGTKRRIWHTTSIVRILSNEKYIGKYIWNKRKQIRNPKTGRKELIPRPEAEWESVYRSELVIVSNDLWAAAHESLHDANKFLTGKRRGGMNRTGASRRYIFSGLMKCGVCGGKINIIGGKPPYAQYGCHNNRFLDSCQNRLTITQRGLEQQLLAQLSNGLQDPRLAAHLSSEFEEQLKTAYENEAKLAQEAANSANDLRARRSVLQTKMKNVLDAIVDFGPSSDLKERHQELQTEFAALERKLLPRVKPVLYTAEQIRTFLDRKMTDITAVLAGDPELAKREIQKRVKELILTPFGTDVGRGYEVTGDLSLLSSEEDVMVDSCFQTSGQHYSAWVMPIKAVLVRKPKRELPVAA
jgi:site-specific DNA recombinase